VSWESSVTEKNERALTGKKTIRIWRKYWIKQRGAIAESLVWFLLEKVAQKGGYLERGEKMERGRGEGVRRGSLKRVAVLTSSKYVLFLPM
jgi:hypothetical protein